MTGERKIYLGCLVGMGLLTLLGVLLAFQSWQMGAPASLLAAQLLALPAGGLVMSMAWRAFQGTRPTPRDPAWIALDLMTPAGLLLIAMALWELRR